MHTAEASVNKPGHPSKTQPSDEHTAMASGEEVNFPDGAHSVEVNVNVYDHPEGNDTIDCHQLQLSYRQQSFPAQDGTYSHLNRPAESHSSRTKTAASCSLAAAPRRSSATIAAAERPRATTPQDQVGLPTIAAAERPYAVARHGHTQAPSSPTDSAAEYSYVTNTAQSMSVRVGGYEEVKVPGNTDSATASDDQTKLPSDPANAAAECPAPHGRTSSQATVATQHSHVTPAAQLMPICSGGYEDVDVPGTTDSVHEDRGPVPDPQEPTKPARPVEDLYAFPLPKEERPPKAKRKSSEE